MDSYLVKLSLRRNGVEERAVFVEVPSQYAWDPQWGVQVPEPEEPGQTLDVGGEFLLEAALRGEHGLVILPDGASQDGEPSRDMDVAVANSLYSGDE